MLVWTSLFSPEKESPEIDELLNLGTRYYRVGRVHKMQLQNQYECKEENEIKRSFNVISSSLQSAYSYKLYSQELKHRLIARNELSALSSKRLVLLNVDLTRKRARERWNLCSSPFCCWLISVENLWFLTVYSRRGFSLMKNVSSKVTSLKFLKEFM